MSVKDVIEEGGLEEFISAMDPNVEWRGLGDDPPVCRNRDEVRRVFEGWLARGYSGAPEIVAESGDRLVVDPHVQPPPPEAPQIHHVFTVREDRIVKMQDYPDRPSALKAAAVS